MKTLSARTLWHVATIALPQTALLLLTACAVHGADLSPIVPAVATARDTSIAERHAPSFDWLAVSAAHFIGDTLAVERSNALLRDNPGSVIALSELFARVLTPEERLSLTKRLNGALDESPVPLMNIRRDPSAFIAQATSVLRYITITEGEDAAGLMAGSAAAGYSVREMLAALPVPTTPEVLERGWWRWATGLDSNMRAAELAR